MRSRQRSIAKIAKRLLMGIGCLIAITVVAVMGVGWLHWNPNDKIEVSIYISDDYAGVIYRVTRGVR